MFVPSSSAGGRRWSPVGLDGLISHARMGLREPLGVRGPIQSRPQRCRRMHVAAIGVVCPDCQAKADSSAHSCARCRALTPARRRSPGQPPPPPPRAVGPESKPGLTPRSAPPQAPQGSLRRRFPTLVLVLIVVVAGWAVNRDGGARGGASPLPGSIDARGFRPSFVDVKSNTPVRFNPCEAIHYAINPALAPPSAIEDVRTAFEMTAETTGMEFVYDGTTNEVPTPERPSYQPDRYGRRWAPVLIGWTSGAPFSITSEVAGASAIGAGGSVFEYNEEGRPVYVTGLAAFDADADLRPGFGGQTWGQAMLHELGHIVGLGHVDDPASVMNPVIGLRAASWGGADRDGLWALGMGGACVRTPSLP